LPCHLSGVGRPWLTCMRPLVFVQATFLVLVLLRWSVIQSILAPWAHFFNLIVQPTVSFPWLPLFQII